MSLEITVLEQELTRLEENRTGLLDCEKGLRAFETGPEFMCEGTVDKFLDLLGKFQSFVTVIPVEKLSMPPREEKPAEQPAPTQSEEKTETGQFTLEKVLAVAVVVGACTIAVQQMSLPPPLLFWVSALSLILMFLPQIRGFVSYLVSLLKGEEKEEQAEDIVDWACDRLAYMRNRYMEAMRLARFQSQKVEDLERYRLRGRHPATFVRRDELRERLSTEFQSITGRIVTECNNSTWMRKTVVMHLMAQARQAAIMQQKRD